MTDTELLKEILNTIKRLEKAGTLQKMFINAPELSYDEKIKISTPLLDHDCFNDIRDIGCLMTAQELKNMEKCMSRAKFCFEYHHKLYEDYKSREDEIKNPDILKFIKDYEASYCSKEEK